MTDKTNFPTTVFVSGASGFIAQELIKQLIIKGYNVIGSVRSTTKGESIKSNLTSSSTTQSLNSVCLIIQLSKIFHHQEHLIMY